MEAAAALTDMYDQALLGILQHVGNVEEFLRVLFGFLYRKTDFYRLLLRPGDRLGFPPGAAQAMALQVPAGRPGLLHPPGLEGLPGPVALGRLRRWRGPAVLAVGCWRRPRRRCCPRRWASPAVFASRPRAERAVFPGLGGGCLPAGRPGLLCDGCGGDAGRAGTGAGQHSSPQGAGSARGGGGRGVGQGGGCWPGREA